jgi:hypothetical protein
VMNSGKIANIRSKLSIPSQTNLRNLHSKWCNKCTLYEIYFHFGSNYSHSIRSNLLSSLMLKLLNSVSLWNGRNFSATGLSLGEGSLRLNYFNIRQT